MTDPNEPAPTPSRDSETVQQLKKAAAERVDEMVAESFPASDPPAAWTWEVPPTKPTPGD